jgi:hypothetical protein
MNLLRSRKYLQAAFKELTLHAKARATKAFPTCHLESIRFRYLEYCFRSPRVHLLDDPSHEHSSFVRWHASHLLLRLDARRGADKETPGKLALRVMYKASLLKALGIGHIVRDLAGAVVVFLKFLIEANDDL